MKATIQRLTMATGTRTGESRSYADDESFAVRDLAELDLALAERGLSLTDSTPESVEGGQRYSLSDGRDLYVES